MTLLDSNVCPKLEEDAPVLETTSTQNHPLRRTHRRSSAVSLDWSLTQLLDNTVSTTKQDTLLMDAGTVRSVSDTFDPKESADFDKSQNGVDCPSVLSDKKDSLKKCRRFHGHLWTESISSLAHLYLRGLCKKKSSKNHGPIESNAGNCTQLLSSCTTSWEPLIDLDAALLTETSDPVSFGGSKRHRRSRSMSTVLSSYTCSLGNPYNKSYQRRGYPLKRKMSVIIEDTDIVLNQPLSSQKNVTSTAQVDEVEVEQLVQEGTASNVDSVGLHKENVKSNDSESIPDQGNLHKGDSMNAPCLGDTGDVEGKFGNAARNDEQNSIKNTKIKSRLRYMFRGFLGRKSS
ncbi:hypothetical protein PCK1_001623 [Pneumocystis canis]|nr:hypothetical protein PCK1_001623 [Pneumocystis canis]